MKYPQLERLGDRVPDLPDDECWPWRGNAGPAGYGQAYDPTRMRTAGAHRVVWKLIHGQIPDGHHVDHTCHDPSTCQGGIECPHRLCVNPAHLACIPGKSNILRSSGPSALNAGKTHCKRGHEFTPENTQMIRIQYGMARRCRICSALRQRQQVIDRGGKARPRRQRVEVGESRHD